MGKVADVLRETERRLRSAWTPSWDRCVLVHLAEAAEGRLEDTDPFCDARDLLSEVVYGCASPDLCIGEWNDRQTSVEPVLAAVTRAIELAEERGL